MRKHNFAFIDIEATGPDIEKHEIVEIGCVLTSPSLEVIEEFDLKVTPEHMETADPTALKVIHYQDRDWEGSMPLPEAMNILADKVRDSIMVGHNVAFDSSFLERAFSTQAIGNTMHYHRLDTVSIAWAKMHRDPNLEHFSLRELCAHFGIKNENAHTALSDARATYELYKKLMSL